MNVWLIGLVWLCAAPWLCAAQSFEKFTTDVDSKRNLDVDSTRNLDAEPNAEPNAEPTNVEPTNAEPNAEQNPTLGLSPFEKLNFDLKTFERELTDWIEATEELFENVLISDDPWLQSSKKKFNRWTRKITRKFLKWNQRVIRKFVRWYYRTQKIVVNY